jgi:hypothetical protein
LVWFTVELSDKPGSLALLAGALGQRGINITAIVGIAEDTGGALMLSTSDQEGTRQAFADLGLAFEQHDADEGVSLDDHPRVSRGLSDRGFEVR